MNPKKDTTYGIKRLESKNAKAAIIQKISADFHLMPIIAEVYYKQISDYFAPLISDDWEANKHRFPPSYPMVI